MRWLLARKLYPFHRGTTATQKQIHIFFHIEFLEPYSRTNLATFSCQNLGPLGAKNGDPFDPKFEVIFDTISALWGTRFVLLLGWLFSTSGVTFFQLLGWLFSTFGGRFGPHFWGVYFSLFGHTFGAQFSTNFDSILDHFGCHFLDTALKILCGFFCGFFFGLIFSDFSVANFAHAQRPPYGRSKLRKVHALEPRFVIFRTRKFISSK